MLVTVKTGIGTFNVPRLSCVRIHIYFVLTALQCLSIRPRLLSCHSNHVTTLGSCWHWWHHWGPRLVKACGLSTILLFHLGCPGTWCLAPLGRLPVVPVVRAGDMPWQMTSVTTGGPLIVSKVAFPSDVVLNSVFVASAFGPAARRFALLPRPLCPS